MAVCSSTRQSGGRSELEEELRLNCIQTGGLRRLLSRRCHPLKLRRARAFNPPYGFPTPGPWAGVLYGSRPAWNYAGETYA